MTSRLPDLTPEQIRAMIVLDDGGAHEESIGREIGQIRSPLLPAVRQLVRLGLAEVAPGWRDTVWIRLTERGRKVREKGAA